MTKELSESLLAACKAAGIDKPKYIAQDKDGEVWSFDLKPSKKQTICDGVWDGDKARKIDHPSYADDWKESLLEWVEPQEMLPTVFIPHEGEPLADVLARHGEHVADASKKVDDACEIGYHAHLEKGNVYRWTRLDCYRAAWHDALAWKGGASE